MFVGFLICLDINHTHLMKMVDGIMHAFATPTAKKIARPDMPDTPQILLSHKKSEQILGWKPVWTWEESCNDMKKECIENPIELMWGPVDPEDMIH